MPDVYKKADKILQSNGYIAYMLTGRVSQDLSQGYGWQCFDIRAGRWDDGLVKAFGLRRELLPDIVPCHEIIGRVTAGAAAQTGLAEGTPVVAGGLDAACGTLGSGVIEPGQTQEQGGQAGGMSICADACRADPRLILGFHVVPGRWLLQGGTVGGGGVLRWLEGEFAAAERLAAAESGGSVYAELDALAAKIPPGCEGALFLPYMSGERSPIWNPDAKGVFYGLDYGKSRAHFIRAGLEGVAFSLRHNLEVAQAAGVKADRLRATGGAAASRLWTQIKSDVTGKAIDVPAAETATTLGAALLAGVAVGMYGSFAEAVAATVRLLRAHEPNPANKAAYDGAYAAYLELYRRLEPMMSGRRDV